MERDPIVLSWWIVLTQVSFEGPHSILTSAGTWGQRPGQYLIENNQILQLFVGGHFFRHKYRACSTTWQLKYRPGSSLYKIGARQELYPQSHSCGDKMAEPPSLTTPQDGARGSAKEEVIRISLRERFGQVSNLHFKTKIKKIHQELAELH